MSETTLLLTLGLAILPISELRGAIPYAVLRGTDILPAALIATAANALVPLLAYFFLATFHRWFYKMAWYRKFFDRFVEKARTKVHASVEKWGYLGLLIFVAIPLPMTGAWTGALGAWILGMNKKKASLAIMGGVVVAGLVVTLLVAILGAGAKTIFFKAF